MSEEQNIKYNFHYNLKGIDQSIRKSQRLLYLMNSIRLVVVDFNKMMEKPTLEHFMWTAIQLHQAWSNLYRLIKMTNQAQRIGVAQGVLGGVGGRAAGRGLARATGVMGVNQAMGALFDPTWALPPALGALAGIPGGQLLLGIYAGLILLGMSGAGYMRFFGDRQLRSELEEAARRRREIAKLQGYDF